MASLGCVNYCYTICLVCFLYTQVIENIDSLVQLDSLYLGKNKITQIQNLSSLTQLTILSLQVRHTHTCAGKLLSN